MEGPSRASRHMVTIAANATVVALVILLLGAHNRPDVDLWLHLRLGDFLASGGRFGLPDPFVVLADHPYLPNQWLADRAGIAVWNLAGLPGVEAIRLVGVLGLLGGILLACRQVAGPGSSAGALVVATFCTAAGWGERPQLAGLVLLAWSYAAWLRAVRLGRTPWFLIPLAWVFASIHGLWVTSVGLGVAVTVAALVDRRLSAGQAARFLAVSVASVAAAAVTPLGPRALLEPFAVSARLAGTVNEWQRPAWTNPLLLVLLAASAATLARWWWRRASVAPSIGRALLLAVAIVASLSAVRLLAVAAVVLAPLVAEAWSPGREGDPREKLRRRLTRSERYTWLLAAVVTTALALPGILRTPPPPVPVAVTSAMRSLPAGTVAVADPRVSGWVLWSAPSVRPLRDLRSELYDRPTAAAYDRFEHAQPGWDTYARNHDVRAALLDSTGPLARAMASDPTWQVVTEQDGWQLWRRTG